MIIDHAVELLPIESRRSRSAEPASAPVCCYLTSIAHLILSVPQHQRNMLMEAIRHICIHELSINMSNMVSCLHSVYHLFIILRILNHRKYEWIFSYFFLFFSFIYLHFIQLKLICFFNLLKFLFSFALRAASLLRNHSSVPVCE